MAKPIIQKRQRIEIGSKLKIIPLEGNNYFGQRVITKNPYYQKIEEIMKTSIGKPTCEDSGKGAICKHLLKNSDGKEFCSYANYSVDGELFQLKAQIYFNQEKKYNLGIKVEGSEKNINEFFNQLEKTVKENLNSEKLFFLPC